MSPTRLNLKKDEKLEIEWSDGHKSVFTIDYLRSMCPCAQCREVRRQTTPKKVSLAILPGNYSQKLSVMNAELVGNYAIKLEFSDHHDTGIFSFEYLRSLEGH